MFSTTAEDYSPHPFAPPEKDMSLKHKPAVHLPFRSGWELHLLTAVVC